jgi:hypothetical protein
MATPATPSRWENAYRGAMKQRAFAWAKYYEAVNQRLNADYNNVTIINRTIVGDAVVPAHIKEELMEMATRLKKEWECPICMEMIKPDGLEITNCGHYFCKGCITTYKTNKVDCKCPVCRRKI